MEASAGPTTPSYARNLFESSYDPMQHNDSPAPTQALHLAEIPLEERRNAEPVPKTKAIQKVAP